MARSPAPHLGADAAYSQLSAMASLSGAVEGVKMKRKNIYGKPPFGPLYRAVHIYVKKHGGSVTVIGGIQVQQWPKDNAGVFWVAVKCLGKVPVVVERK